MNFHISCLIAVMIIGIMNTSVTADRGLFSGGEGTEQNPYIISTVQDFNDISKYPDKYFVQANDISFMNDEISTIGSEKIPFTGHYDGGYYALKNISINFSDRTYVGIWGYSQGDIKNLNIFNCSIKVNINNGTAYAGAVAGYNSGSISDCCVEAEIYASSRGEKSSVYSGGVCGYSDTDIAGCTFNGSSDAVVSYAESNAYSGGICAFGSAYDCINNGDITSVATASSDAYSGGIAGQSFGQITNCRNKGKINATKAETSYAGGIAGYSSSRITGCLNSGEVYAVTQYAYDETYSGGIAGYSRGKIMFSKNYGTVHADSSTSHVRTGGISGHTDGEIENSKNYGYIYGGSENYESRIGGIAGCVYTGGSVKRCCNYGNVSSQKNGPYSCGFAGGIVGIAQYSNVLQCCNHGNIISESMSSVSFSGGITGGSSEATLFDCYNTGKVHHIYNGTKKYNAGGVGGISGDGEISCLYCYNIGDVSKTSDYTQIGGIIGFVAENSSNAVEYCYSAEVYQDVFAIKITREFAMNKSTYEGFDFENVWQIEENSSIPYLRTIPADEHDNWYNDNQLPVTITDCKISSVSYCLNIRTKGIYDANIYVVAYDARNKAIQIDTAIFKDKNIATAELSYSEDAEYIKIFTWTKQLQPFGAAEIISKKPTT